MQQPSPDRLYAEIRASTAKLAGIVAGYDADLPVPTCPGWTLRQLATHLGLVHRWAAEIVRTRSPSRIPLSSAPDASCPAEPAARAAWLTAGAERVIAEIEAAGSEPVWAFSTLAPASFWARRQAHETMTHRADAELAVGLEPVLDPVLAADGIDEWLAASTDPGFRQRGDGSGALAAGTTLALRATAPESAGWLVSNTGGGLSVRAGRAGSGQAEVIVTGPAGRLFLVLVRRLPADDAAPSVTGDAAVFARWLAGTPL